jgi:hypothetical protein
MYRLKLNVRARTGAVIKYKSCNQMYGLQLIVQAEI